MRRNAKKVQAFKLWEVSMDRERKLPWNLKKRELAGGDKYFFTCGRPGYCPKDKNKQVSGEEVSAWVLGLPGPDRAVVSLLGCKPDGRSEFRFYPFHGAWDSLEERGNKPSFQEWVDHHHPDLEVVVKQHPTWNKGIGSDEVEAIAAVVGDLISQGRTAIVVDSAGVSRTGQVAKFFRV